MSLPVLIVDDDPQVLLSVSVTLRSAGVEDVLTVDDSLKVIPLLEKRNVMAVVLDLFMPHLSGEELLGMIRDGFPHVPVIVMTAANEIDTAVECMKSGAFDYLVKPVSENRFVSSVKRAMELYDLRTEASSLKHRLLTDTLEHEEAFAPIITNSRKMRSIFQYTEAIAESGQPVMITGETGVGKELIALTIHAVSGLKGEFVAVNVAGLDDAMFSDVLFGHKKGAYTGAAEARSGLVARALGGTLFLDEIGDLNEASQVKLLRLLQEKSYYSLGSDVLRHSDARVLVATNRNLDALLAEGKFRKDLYYRLRAHQVAVPPLRERKEDIHLLVEHFISDTARAMKKKRPAYPPELITLLSTYDFPGNVRELQSMLLDAMAQHKSGILSMDSFKALVGQKPPSSQVDSSPSAEGVDCLIKSFGRFPTLKETTDYLILEALKLSDGKQGIAASLLGMTRQALNKRLKRKTGSD
jgi:DNA-binding NtrC family response regulator